MGTSYRHGHGHRLWLPYGVHYMRYLERASADPQASRYSEQALVWAGGLGC